MDFDMVRAEVGLIDRDPVLGGVVKEYGPLDALVVDEYFYSLAESIVSQQLSVKASDTIFGRLREATALDPLRVLSLSDEQCEQIGLSGQKQRYLRDLARHFVDNPAVFAHLDTLGDEAVIAELTGVVGIGRWTAQMFLIFTLARPDVFAPDDLGLQNAIMRLYDLPEKPTPKQAAAFAERWAPYRSTACRYLWKSLDNTPL